MPKLQPRTLAPCVRRSTACWGQCHYELRHLAVDTERRHTQEHSHSHTLHTLHGTAAITAAAGPELPRQSSHRWLPAATAALASSAPSAIAPSESAKEPATGYRYVRHRLLLNRRGHYGWPTQGARSLEPLFSGSESYLVFKFRIGLQLDETAASLLHCTALLHTGHTQTRVDLCVAPLLL